MDLSDRLDGSRGIQHSGHLGSEIESTVQPNISFDVARLNLRESIRVWLYSGPRKFRIEWVCGDGQLYAAGMGLSSDAYQLVKGYRTAREHVKRDYLKQYIQAIGTTARVGYSLSIDQNLVKYIV